MDKRAGAASERTTAVQKVLLRLGHLTFPFLFLKCFKLLQTNEFALD